MFYFFNRNLFLEFNKENYAEKKVKEYEKIRNKKINVINLFGKFKKLLFELTRRQTKILCYYFVRSLF